MGTETCQNCKRIIGELEQAYTWQSHILCKECYARLSSPTVAKPTPVDGLVPAIQPPPQRSLVKSTLIVMATVIAVIVMIYILLFILFLYKEKQKEEKYLPVIATNFNLMVLHSAVKLFEMDTGRLPTEEEGLSVLVQEPSDVKGYAPGGYLESKTIPIDGWGNDFVYQLSPDSYKPFVIISYGADGKEGGEDINADLFSTDPY